MERSINNKIIEKYHLVKPNSCTCEKCVGACKMSPCTCTPDDIIDMIENYRISSINFRQSLNLTYWYMDMVSQPIIFIGLKDKGAANKAKLSDDGFCKVDDCDKKSLECCMLENGLCKIHDFKPMGGIYTDTHEEDPFLIFSSKSPEFLVLKSWTERENIRSIEKASLLVNGSEHFEFMNLISLQIQSFKVLCEKPTPFSIFKYMTKVNSLLNKMK